MALTQSRSTAALAALQTIVGATTTQSLPVAEAAAIAATEVWIPAFQAADATAHTAATLWTFRAPFAGSVIDVRANLVTAGTVAAPSFDVRKAGTSIFTTIPTFNVTTGLTLVGASLPWVLKTDGTQTFLEDDVITIVGVVAGTGTAGLKVWLKFRRTS